MESWKEFGDVVRDPYPFSHKDKNGEQDANLWLNLLVKAKEVDFELFSILYYLRDVGANIVPSPKFGHKIVPIVNEDSWISEEQYNKEKQYLVPYKDKLAKLLKNLEVM